MEAIEQDYKPIIELILQSNKDFVTENKLSIIIKQILIAIRYFQQRKMVHGYLLFDNLYMKDSFLKEENII